MHIHVLKFVLRFHCLASLNLKCATKIYNVYPTVSCTNTHFNHNRLRINCMHISKYISLRNILSHRNVSSYTNSEMKMASSFLPANSFNMQSNILTCTKNINQELLKHLSLSTSTTEVVSHRLLPLPIQTTDHEKWSMICNIACPAPTSKILITLNAVKFLIKPDVLSGRHFIKQETTVPVFLRHVLHRVTKCIKSLVIDAGPKMNSIEEGLQGAS